MILNPTPALMDSLYWITLIAVIVSSTSGVLKAGFKQFDLFGVIIIAIATGLRCANPPYGSVVYSLLWLAAAATNGQIVGIGLKMNMDGFVV